MRSANKGLKPKAIAACQTCQAPIATHQACQECGYYKGTKILRTKSDRMYQRGKAKQAKEQQVKMASPAATAEGGAKE
jgi:ribosomal protein L32